MNYKNDVPLEGIIAMREFMTSKEAYPDGRFSNDTLWSYLTLYDPGGGVIARSSGHGSGVNIIMVYNGITFLALPGTGQDCCYAQWQSITNYVNEYV